MLSLREPNGDFSSPGGITTVGLPALALESSSGTANDTSDGGGNAVDRELRSNPAFNSAAGSSATSTDIVREWPRLSGVVNVD